jgi:hypothetical protein
MVPPHVVGHIDPVCLVEVKNEREARISIRRAGLVGGADREPAHPAVCDVVADPSFRSCHTDPVSAVKGMTDPEGGM